MERREKVRGEGKEMEFFFQSGIKLDVANLTLRNMQLNYVSNMGISCYKRWQNSVAPGTFSISSMLQMVEAI